MQGKFWLTGDVGGMNLAIKSLDDGGPGSWLTYFAALFTGV